MNGSKIAKNVAYVLVPIFALLLVLATLGTAIIDEKITETGNEYYGIQIAKGFADTTKGATPFFIPISIAILVILVAIIINGIGKEKNGDIVKLNWFDNWKLEIVLILSFGIFWGGFTLTVFGWSISNISMNMLLISCGIAVLYVNMIVLLETIVKRIKARMLWKTTLIYAIYKAIKKMIDNRKIMTKLFIYY